MLRTIFRIATLTAVIVGVPTLAHAAASAASDDCGCPLCSGK